MKIRSLLLIVWFICFIPGCFPGKIAVDYQPTSVPEEGGISFTQFTREDEAILGPYIDINEVSGMLEWYAAPFIAISPDGERLAYSAQTSQGANIHIKNTRGGRATVQRTYNRNILDMSFSPDGGHIAFTDRIGINRNIFMINSSEGMAVQQITSSSNHELGPYFAPDGKSIFFTRAEGNRYYIWNFNLETSLLTQYSRGFTPCITPDGENMIITRNSQRGRRGEIWMINLLTGMESLILSDQARGFSSPHISPDGSKIVCVGTTPATNNRPQNLDIYTVNIDGTNLTQLTFHGGHDVSPVWAPDGRSIYFISQRGNIRGRYNVWNMDVGQ